MISWCRIYLALTTTSPAFKGHGFYNIGEFVVELHSNHEEKAHVRQLQEHKASKDFFGTVSIYALC